MQFYLTESLVESLTETNAILIGEDMFQSHEGTFVEISYSDYQRIREADRDGKLKLSVKHTSDGGMKYYVCRHPKVEHSHHVGEHRDTSGWLRGAHHGSLTSAY